MCKNLPGKSAHNPTVPMLRKEVKRRVTLFKVTVTSSTMSRTAAVQWLTENPIGNVLCKDWLRVEEAKICDTAHDAINEQARIATMRLAIANWNSLKPWLRLCLAMFEDRAKTALLITDRVKDRAELDAGVSTERPDTFEEAIASIYNDEAIVLTTDVLPNLHELFSDPMTLRFSERPGGESTAEEAKSRIGDAHAKIIQVTSDVDCFSLVLCP